jgi:hypothetical protein
MAFMAFKIIRLLHLPLDITGCDSERRAKSSATICHNAEAGTAIAAIGWMEIHTSRRMK